MALEEYSAYKEIIASRVRLLGEFAAKVERYKLLMDDKTNGYVSAITKQREPFADSWFYIIRWFRTFVGIKDEAMLLINGELLRKYHKQVHADHIHSRGSEDKYYKPGLLGLSGCCVDGLNYDIRRIASKFPSFAVSAVCMAMDRAVLDDDRCALFCRQKEERSKFSIG